jgi:hypothetical protein
VVNVPLLQLDRASAGHCSARHPAVFVFNWLASAGTATFFGLLAALFLGVPDRAVLKPDGAR